MPSNGAPARSLLAAFNSTYLGIGKPDPELVPLAELLRRIERGGEAPPSKSALDEDSLREMLQIQPAPVEQKVQRARDIKEWAVLSVAADTCAYHPEHLRRLCVANHRLPPNERSFQCRRDGKLWEVELNSLRAFRRRKQRRTMQ
jgi:hypothetical protein